jgi:hypothetical protein
MNLRKVDDSPCWSQGELGFGIKLSGLIAFGDLSFGSTETMTAPSSGRSIKAPWRPIPFLTQESAAGGSIGLVARR